MYIRTGNAGRTENIFIDILRYVFRLNKPIYLNPTFDLSGSNINEKRKKHQTNFDFVEIPSDILIRDLRKIGFQIVFFSTYKEVKMYTGEYDNLNIFNKIIYKTFVKLNVFPFNHLGRTIIMLCKKT